MTEGDEGCSFSARVGISTRLICIKGRRMKRLPCVNGRRIKTRLPCVKGAPAIAGEGLF